MNYRYGYIEKKIFKMPKKIEWRDSSVIKALASLSEDPVLTLSTHKLAHNCPQFQITPHLPLAYVDTGHSNAV